MKQQSNTLENFGMTRQTYTISYFLHLFSFVVLHLSYLKVIIHKMGRMKLGSSTQTLTIKRIKDDAGQNKKKQKKKRR